jgi:hypothetical protein
MGSGRSQKNDPIDARSIAIAALRSDRLGVVEPDDHVVVLRLLVKRHRDMAKLRKKNTAHVSTRYSSNSRPVVLGQRSLPVTLPGSSTGSRSLMRRPGIGSWLLGRSSMTLPDSTNR